jgi:hypothetical protein
MNFTATNLGMRLTASYRWCTCDSGCLMGYARYSVPKIVAFYPEPRIFGNRLVVFLAGAPYRVFRSTLQGFESTGCRPLTVI